MSCAPFVRTFLCPLGSWATRMSQPSLRAAVASSIRTQFAVPVKRSDQGLQGAQRPSSGSALGARAKRPRTGTRLLPSPFGFFFFFLGGGGPPFVLLPVPRAFSCVLAERKQRKQP